RSKRSLVQFGLMIKCTTGRSAFDYNGYGCWCGKGGSGRAVDATDRCCLIHDRCYDAVIRDRVCPWGINVYTTVYFRKGCNIFGKTNNPCQYRICQCDSAAVRCFKRSYYNNRYKDYNKNKYCRKNRNFR
ncbi:predicted protein, partial [Nematostella vectensis]